MPCAGDPSKAYWDGAVRHGYNSGAGDLGFGPTDWAVMINAPGEPAAAGARPMRQCHVKSEDPAVSASGVIPSRKA